MCTIGALAASSVDPAEHPDRCDRVRMWMLPAIRMIAIALSLCACSEPSAEPITTQRRTLLDHRQWTTIASTDDPLPTHQPAVIECGVAGWFIEFDALEIDTGRCNYLLIEHPALLSVAAGSEITTQLRYYDLEAPEPAEAHVAILIGDELQWETMVAIPQTANVIDVAWRTPDAIEVGDPIRLHLHNHGQNHWGLDAIMAEVLTSP